jgi:hypothetical protein
LKNKVFKGERVTQVGLDDIGTSTTLESNKSQGYYVDPLALTLSGLSALVVGCS